MMSGASGAIKWTKDNVDPALVMAALTEIPRWTVAFLAIHEPLWVGIPLGALLAWALKDGWACYFRTKSGWVLVLNLAALSTAIAVITPVLYAMTSVPVDQVDLTKVMSGYWLMGWSALLALSTFLPLIQLSAVRSFAAPDTGKSDTGKSDTGKSDTGKSDTGKSDTGKSDTGKSDTGKSDTGKSDTGKSDTGKSDTGKSDTGKSDTGKSDTGGRKPVPAWHEKGNGGNGHVRNGHGKSDNGKSPSLLRTHPFGVRFSDTGKSDIGQGAAAILSVEIAPDADIGMAKAWDAEFAKSGKKGEADAAVGKMYGKSPRQINRYRSGGWRVPA